MSTIEEKIAEWQKELLQFDNRNRLLNFRHSSSRPSTIPLVDPSISSLYQLIVSGKKLTLVGTEFPADGRIADDEAITPEASRGEVETIAAEDFEHTEQNGWSTSIERPPDAPTASPTPLVSGSARSPLMSEKLHAVAHRLSDQARTSDQEQGINVLYAAFGFLKWFEEGGKNEERRSPIILVPLTITESVRGSSFQISINSAEEPELNLTLIERLRRDFGLNIGLEFDEEVPIASVFEQIRGIVKTKEGWSIAEEAYIGIFRFHKIRMFKDLSEHAAIAAQHEVVQALGLDGVTLAPSGEVIPDDADLDQIAPPSNSFTILDADASQLRAIETVKRGCNLIIYGPPGTGKSQTIANIIAEALTAQKTVLFVAEKSAALEVVHQRLAGKGLDEFCLMLHSQKATKRDVIAALGLRLRHLQTPSQGPEVELGLKRLGELRSELNMYAAEIGSENNSFGKSAFWVHGQLARLQMAPYLTAAPPSVETMTFEQYDHWTRRIEALASHGATLRAGDNHPWSGIRAAEVSLSDRSRLQANLTRLLASTEALLRDGTDLSAQISQPSPRNLSEAKQTLDIQRSVPVDFDARVEWFDPSVFVSTMKLSSEGIEQAKFIQKADEELLKEWSPQIFDLASDEILEAYERSSFLSRMFSSTYRSYRTKIRSAALDQRKRSHSEILGRLRTANKRSRAVQWFRSNESLFRSTLGTALVPDAAGLDRLNRIMSQLSKTSSIVERVPDVHLGAELINNICTPGFALRTSSIAAKVERQLQDIEAGLAELQDVFESKAFQIDGVPLSSAGLESLIDWAALRLKEFDELNSWLDAQAELRRANADGLESVATALVGLDVDLDQWVNASQRLILTHWLVSVYGASEALRRFRGEIQEQNVSSFRRLDRQFVSGSANRIRRTIAASQRTVSANSGGEPEILRREVSKQRRHLPVRKLFERIPNLLTSLKPCLMMSPLSVAQFIPANYYKFDIVIFDEASQVRPHDAIGAIIRGKQLVVAGDSKQLPPTSFFDRNLDDATQEDETSLKDMESILDALKVKHMPDTELVWHYRSRHEDLIAFSNRHFYANRLVTFPDSSTDRGPERGLRFEYVADGVYHDERDRVLQTSIKVNRVEARRVAKLVVEHARRRPEETLGVVALGSNQREVVREEITRARLLDSSLDEFFREDRTLPFFVKALEEVQGDERDVMIVSVGYGKGVDGKLSHNFGPLNRDGGERRLNVLITRAKHQVIVVSSIRASDIDLSRTQKLGPRLLREYLDFAERGAVALESATSGGSDDYESPFEEEVGAALERAGYVVQRQIGCSKFRVDLAVIHPRFPGRYLLGIECDGATYHSSRTARDRDRLRQEILESLGWRIHRVWSTDWIRQPEKEFSRLLVRIEQEMATPSSPANLGLSDQEADEQPRESVDDETLEILVSLESGAASENQFGAPMGEQYVEAEVRTGNYPDILNAPLSSVVDNVISCVQIESPIHHDMIVRRISSGWSYNRTGTRIANRINQAISSAANSHRIEKRGSFYWFPGETKVVVRSSTAVGAVRQIEHVAGEEILAAFSLTLANTLSLGQDELIQHSARLLGYQRTGSEIQIRLSAMIQVALANDILAMKNGRLVLV